MSKILVTGASGFVGHAVIKSLREQGHVICGTTRDETAKRGPENIPLYLVPKLNKDTDWDNVITGADVIIHLAAVSHANKSNKDPHSTFDHSLRTLENTLDFAKNPKTHVIYMSSSMVYGNFEKDFVDEESQCNPIGIYGTLKYSGELIVKAYNNGAVEYEYGGERFSSFKGQAEPEPTKKETFYQAKLQLGPQKVVLLHLH